MRCVMAAISLSRSGCWTRRRLSLRTEAAAVGSRSWIEQHRGRMPESWTRIEDLESEEDTCVLRMSRRRHEGLFGILSR